jgi:hypothetical protein
MATQTVTLSNPPGSNFTYNGVPGFPDDNYIITDTGGANYTITLGNGTDQLTLLNGNNTLTLGNGADQIVAAAGNNTITTGNGNSNITVGNGNDTITVGTGSNTIVLGTGLDTVSTGFGNNVVSVSGVTVSGDTLMGALTSGDGTTNQLVLTAAGTMSPVNVSGFASWQLANGGPNSLTLSEGNFAHLPGGRITVSDGNSGDTINASALSAAHSVTIDAGAGIENLTGGAGDDRFVFKPGNFDGDTVDGGAGNNTLELAAGGAGTLNGLGTNFVNIGTVVLDANATWAIGIGNPAAFTGTISGFVPGDTFDLTNFAFNSAGSAKLGSGNVLRIDENGSTVTINLDPNQNFMGDTFGFAPDSRSGTLVSVAPSAPAGLTLAPASDSGVKGDDITNVTIPTITGTGVAGDTVTLHDGATAVGSATVAANGSWSIGTSALAPGGHTLTATQTDAAGNVSAASAALSLTIDTAPPATIAASLTVAGNSAATPIAIPAPTDVNFSASALTVMVSGLPFDGTVLLADGSTAVTQGEALTVAQLTGLEFRPTANLVGASASFTYGVTDPAGNSAAGTAILGIGSGRLITLAPGPQTVTGGAGDTIVGNTGPDVINGLAGSESIIGGSGATTVFGGLGDTIAAGSGNTYIDGTAGGMKIAVGSGGTDTIIGSISAAGAGVDTLAGGAALVQVQGLGKGDVVNFAAQTGNATVNATAGNIAATLGSGGATVYGGAGDTIALGSVSQYVDGTSGAMKIAVGSGGTDIVIGSLAGAAGVGVDTLTGGSAAVQVQGLGKGDVVNFAAQTGTAAINATAGNIALMLGAGGASVYAGAGDTISLGSVSQYVDARAGGATAGGGAGASITLGSGGTDNIIGSTVAGAGVIITGGAASLDYNPGVGNDLINLAGTSAAATINAFGADTGPVNDTVVASNGGDSVWGGQGDRIGVGAGAPAAPICSPMPARSPAPRSGSAAMTRWSRRATARPPAP